MYKNVEIPLNYSKDKLNKKVRVEEILGQLGLAGRVNECAYNLSGDNVSGSQLPGSNNPTIILADELTGAPDQKTGQQVIGIFKEIHKGQKKTVLIVTHDQKIAEQCEEIINIVDGQILEKISC